MFAIQSGVGEKGEKRGAREMAQNDGIGKSERGRREEADWVKTYSMHV